MITLVDGDGLPSFEQFSKEIDEEMRAFAKYMMTRAVAGKLSARRYIVILASLSRGMSMVEYMLEQEGIRKSDIQLALMAMKATDEEIREGFDKLNSDMR